MKFSLSIFLLLCSIRLQAEEIKPISSYALKGAEDAFVVGAGMTVIGEIPVAVYKGLDAGREIGATAVDRQNEIYTAELIVIGKDAQKLHELVVQGKDLKTTPEAIAIMQRMQDSRGQMYYNGNDVGNIAKAFDDNWSYVTTVTIAKEGVAHVAGKFMEEGFGGTMADKLFPAGEYGGALARKEHKYLGQYLQTGVWRKMYIKSDVAKKLSKEFYRKLLAKEAEDIAKNMIEQLGKTDEEVLVLQLEHSHAPKEILQYDISAAVANNPGCYSLLYVPAAPMAYVAPAVAAAIPAPVAVPAAVPAASYCPDPVVRVMINDNTYQERYVRESNYNPPTSPNTTFHIEHDYDSGPSAADLARQAALHAELMQVGDGKHFSWGPPSTGGGPDGRAGSSWNQESH